MAPRPSSPRTSYRPMSMARVSLARAAARNETRRMACGQPPEDLRAFLAEGRELEYDPSCEAGRVTLVPLERLRVGALPRRLPVDAARGARPAPRRARLLPGRGHEPDRDRGRLRRRRAPL